MAVQDPTAGVSVKRFPDEIVDAFVVVHEGDAEPGWEWVVER
jgi:hypothetical protein